MYYILYVSFYFNSTEIFTKSNFIFSLFSESLAFLLKRTLKNIFTIS